MAKKNFFKILIGTTAFVSLEISEVNAAIFKCLSSQDSMIQTPNPLFGMRTELKHNPENDYQAVVEDFTSLEKSENGPQPRKWVYAFMRGNDYRTLGSLANSALNSKSSQSDDLLSLLKEETQSKSLKDQGRRLRNWVYARLRGDEDETTEEYLDLLGSDKNLSLSELWSSTDSTLTSESSRYSDVFTSPDDIMNFSQLTKTSVKEYRQFLKCLNQINNNFVSQKLSATKTLASGSLQSED